MHDGNGDFLSALREVPVISRNQDQWFNTYLRRGEHAIVIRFSAILVAVALIGYPPFLIYAITVQSCDWYLPYMVGFCLGSRFIRRAWAALGNICTQSTFSKAGAWGAFAVGVVVVAGVGVHSRLTQGSFEEGIGNLWGLVLIFAALFAALVSAGVALLFHGLRL
jgi:hypothetical protein